MHPQIQAEPPELGIDWQLSGEPVLAAKDAAGRPLREAELYP